MRKYLLALGFVCLAASRAVATPITLTATLSGLNENPTNASPATGFATITFDSTAHTLAVDLTFSGLLGTSTASHIHCCTASPGVGNATVATQVPTFVGFPIGVTSGTYSHLFLNTLDPSFFNPAFVTAHGGTVGQAETDLFAGLLAGDAYINVHSMVFPGGEIRGNLAPVPEPASLLLLGTGLSLAVRRRLKKRA